MADLSDDIIRYYTDTQHEYRVFWHTDRELALHFGYYDDRTRTHDAAVTRLTEKIAELLRVEKDDQILDTGCGVGGSAFWLAQHRGARVTGVNITPWQVKAAQAEASRRGAEDRVSFVEADFAKTQFPDHSFSVVWGIESIVHAVSQPEFAKEAYRLLKPGGQLMIAQYFVHDDPLSEFEQELIQPWLTGWAMPALHSQEEYTEFVRSAGFRTVTFHDWTEPIRPSFNRLRNFVRVVTPLAPLFHALQIVNDTQLANLRAARAQMQALDRNIWRYLVLVAEK